MKYIIPVLCGFVMLIVIAGVIAYLRQTEETEKGKVHLPKIFVIIGGLVAVIFLIPTIITYLKNEPLWVSLIFLGFSFLGTILIVGFINCRISYDENGFVYKTIFGRKIEYNYSQVTGIRKNMNETYVYVGKRKLLVDALYVGGYDFINQVKKKYREFNGERNIPDIKPKHDIFNGNVNDATGFLIAYGIMAVFTVAFLIFAICTVYLPKTESNTTEQKVVFVSCEEVGEDVVLTTADNKIFKIQYVDEQFNGEKIEEICNGDAAVITYSEEVTPKDGDDYFALDAIKYDNNYILTFGETHRLYKQEKFPVIILAIVFVLAVFGLIIGTIIVGRNPQRYSKRVVRMFFKDGYINY